MFRSVVGAERCMRSAEEEKRNSYLAFLDINKA